MKNNKIEHIIANLENQLDFLENQVLPRIGSLRENLFEEELDSARFYVNDLIDLGQDVTKYQSKINELRKTYDLK